MTAERLNSIPNNSDAIYDQPEHVLTQNLPAEFKELMQPNPEIIHQAGLSLINTRLFMHQINDLSESPITIDEIPTSTWQEQLNDYDMVWFMGIYKPSDFSRNHAIKYPQEYVEALPDLDPENDIVASPFAIPEYTPNPLIANDWDAWDKMVDKLHGMGKKVIIDFVPNQMAVDHPWASEHPEYFIQGTYDQFMRNPSLYQEIKANDGNTYYLAHGKDPYQEPWADNLQLNYTRPEVQNEMEQIALKLATHSDGFRCDMAALPDARTFLVTWGGEPDYDGRIRSENHLSDQEKDFIGNNNFWEKIIPNVKQQAKENGKEDFLFIAESYWDQDKLGENFDYIYGKDFYDHIKKIIVDHENPDEHLRNHVSYLMNAKKEGRKYGDVLFTGNHDEQPPIKVFGENPSKAAASLAGLIPNGIFLLEPNQVKGSRVRAPMQINRPPTEPTNISMENFYKRLLYLKRSKLFQEGDWEIAQISESNDHVVSLQVSIKSNEATDSSAYDKELGAVICINMGHNTSSGRINEITNNTDVSVYRLNNGDFVTNPDTRRESGMFFELLPWETQVFFYSK